MAFEEMTNRVGTNSIKWDSRPDVPADVIPMWVADMDFKTYPPIIEALQRRVEQGIFGYTFVPKSYYEAIDRWFGKYHGWHIPAEQVIYTSGVIPALSAIIKALTIPGDSVILQTPVYNHFFTSVRNNGCYLAENTLKIVNGDTYKSDTYEIDFDNLNQLAADPRCKLLILCNPHNPGGRVWSPDELRRIADICKNNDVVVVSDEIHCELSYGHEYTPFALVAEGCPWVACISPSKAFNIAGLQIANIVCEDKKMRAKIDRAINDNEVCDVNPFGVIALQEAYTEGGHKWLKDLCAYIYKNYEILKTFFSDNFPKLRVFKLEGTYLAWVDCRSLGMNSEELEEYLIREAHVWLNAGNMYGHDGEGFLRVNLACPEERLHIALDRLKPALIKLING